MKLEDHLLASQLHPDFFGRQRACQIERILLRQIAGQNPECIVRREHRVGCGN